MSMKIGIICSFVLAVIIAMSGIASADDFGIPDFSDIRSGFPDALRDLERLIRNTIMKYEPRLQSVRVKFIQQDENRLALSFQIVGKLALEGQKNPVIFESMMDSEGKVTIRT